MYIPWTFPAVLCLAHVALVAAQPADIIVPMNDTQLTYYNSTGGTTATNSWLRESNETACGGMRDSLLPGESVSLTFFGTAGSVDFLAELAGGTAQLLLNGTLIQLVNTSTPSCTTTYCDCNVISASTGPLSPGWYDLMAVHSTAGWMNIQSFGYIPAVEVVGTSTLAPSSTISGPSPTIPVSSSTGSVATPGSFFSNTRNVIIVAGVASGIAVALAVILSVLLIRRCRRKRTHPEEHSQTSSFGDTYQDFSHSSEPKIGSPFGSSEDADEGIGGYDPDDWQDAQLSPSSSDRSPTSPYSRPPPLPPRALASPMRNIEVQPFPPSIPAEASLNTTNTHTKARPRPRSLPSPRPVPTWEPMRTIRPCRVEAKEPDQPLWPTAPNGTFSLAGSPPKHPRKVLCSRQPNSSSWKSSGGAWARLGD